MRPLVLTAARQRRLEKLARDSGRSLAQALRFVLRDGFDFCEWEVRESRAADESARRGRAIPNRDAQRRARMAVRIAARAKAAKLPVREFMRRAAVTYSPNDAGEAELDGLLTLVARTTERASSALDGALRTAAASQRRIAAMEAAAPRRSGRKAA